MEWYVHEPVVPTVPEPTIPVTGGRDLAWLAVMPATTEIPVKQVTL